MESDVRQLLHEAAPRRTQGPDLDLVERRFSTGRRLRRVGSALAVVAIVVGGVWVTQQTTLETAPTVLDQPRPGEDPSSPPGEIESTFELKEDSGFQVERRRRWEEDLPGSVGKMSVEEFVVTGPGIDDSGRWPLPSVMWMRSDVPEGLPTVESIRRDLDRVGDVQGRDYELHRRSTDTGDWQILYVLGTDSTTATLRLDDGSIIKVTAAQMQPSDIAPILAAVRLPAGLSAAWDGA